MGVSGNGDSMSEHLGKFLGIFSKSKAMSLPRIREHAEGQGMKAEEQAHKRSSTQNQGFKTNSWAMKSHGGF